MKDLRPYQKSFGNNIVLSMQQHKSVAAVLPTGGGKTFVFTKLIEYYAERGEIILVLTHRIELLKSAFKDLILQGVTPQVINSSTRYILDSKVYVGMVECVNRRIEKFPKAPSLIITDEAHWDVFQKIYDKFPEAKRIGFTATPIFSMDKNFNDIFEKMVVGASIPQLVQQGYLSKMNLVVDAEIAKKASGGLALRGREYSDETQVKAIEEVKGYQLVLEFIKANPKKTIIFCPNVEVSEKLAGFLTAQGFKCKSVTKNTSKGERTETLKEYESNALDYVTNCGVLTTGYDNPAIINVILFRKTTSLSLYLQMIGRGSRVVKDVKSNFTVYDIFGNVYEHGRWDYDYDWELCFQSKRAFLGLSEAKKEGIANQKFCKSCMSANHITAKVCVICEAEFITEKKDKQYTEASGELMKLEDVFSKIEKSAIEKRYSTIDKAVNIAKKDLSKFLIETRRYYVNMYLYKKNLPDYLQKKVSIRINNKFQLKVLVEAFGLETGKKIFIESLPDDSKFIKRYIDSWLNN